MKKGFPTGLVIGAVIGTLILPGVGTLIGGWIGWNNDKPDIIIIEKEKE